MNIESELLLVKEAAAVLRASKRATETLIKNGELAVVRFGQRNVRVPRSAITDFIASRTIRANGWKQSKAAKA